MISSADIKAAKHHNEAVRLFLERLDKEGCEPGTAPPPPPTIPPITTAEAGIQNWDGFWDYVRGDANELFPTITQPQVDGITAILMQGAGKLPLSWMAYCLATTYHETAIQMQPVREAYWMSEEWRKANLRYYPYYGRGFVQLTWDYNYKKASEECAQEGIIVDLVKVPDDALRLDVSSVTLVDGMIEGWFTGKKLRDYLPNEPTREQYKNARRIINGTDKADLIAGYALEFEEALKKGEWK